MLNNHGDDATAKPTKPRITMEGKDAGNLGGGDGGGNGVGVTVGGSGGGGSGIASTPPPRPGSNASQDLAFLTDAPLLPPAGASRGRNVGSQGGREISGGAILFGEGGMCVADGGWGLGGVMGRVWFEVRGGVAVVVLCRWWLSR